MLKISPIKLVWDVSRLEFFSKRGHFTIITSLSAEHLNVCKVLNYYIKKQFTKNVMLQIRFVRFLGCSKKLLHQFFFKLGTMMCKYLFGFIDRRRLTHLLILA